MPFAREQAQNLVVMRGGAVPWGRFDGHCLNFEYRANGSHGNDFLIEEGNNQRVAAEIV